MVPNFAPWLTDFRTVFVFALGPFLPMKVIFFDFNGNFNGKMAKNYFLPFFLPSWEGKVLEQKQKQF